MHLTLLRRVVILYLLTWKMHAIAFLFMKKYQKYLKLFWKEEHCQYIVPTNGFSPAVRVYAKVLIPPFKYLKSKRYLSGKYIDDSLLLGETFEIWGYYGNSCTLMGTKIHNSSRKISLGSYTTDNIPRVRDRLCKNDNNSDWGKETIYLHALPEYPFKLSSNNQSSSTNHRSDNVLIQSCSIWPNVLQGIGKM